MSIKIALAGNPNSGKTTMFNGLTGSTQYVGNWPGVTVEKKEGKLKNSKKDVILVDLPGIYSLSPYTLEEVVTRNFLINETPDAIINIIDATNLERNLYLTTQLVEIGVPVVVALNMIDIVNKNGDKIDLKKLSESIGCPIIETSAVKGGGLREAAEAAIQLVEKKAKISWTHRFSEIVEQSIEIISQIVEKTKYSDYTRWFSIKLFERDEKAYEQLNLSGKDKENIEKIIQNCEKILDDDAESIITNERYEFISKIISESLQKQDTGNLSTSDKIDSILTNRWLALPIFAAIMWVVYYIAVSSVGTVLTDWINDTFVGEVVQGNMSLWLEEAGAADWLHSLIVDGLIGGVGSVIGFLPQIMILFFLISILEDCGYMARVAFIMDRIFRKFGLSGKSFIPMLIGTGCSVPAIMASRTIENEKDRKMTIMLTPFIPCGAKLPIFALMIGAFFPDKPWIAPSMYFVGIIMVIISGVILKHTPLFSGDVAPFVMELPQYHMPGLKGLFTHVWERIKGFIVKAGTVIFVGCGVIWFLSTFNWSLKMVEAENSILAGFGNLISPLFTPLGFGNWQSSVSIITGLLAKENIVATFGVLFGITEATEESAELVTEIAKMFNVVSAYSFMAFNLLAAPCVAAIGATKREMGGWKWTLIALSYQTGLAYVVAFIINQVGSAIILGESIKPAVIIALAIVAVLILLGVSAYNKNKKKSIAGVAT